jgi:hypothetical protein
MLLSALAIAVAAPMTPALADPPGWSHAGGHGKERQHDDRRHDERRDREARADWRSHDYNRPDPRHRGYYADRYYVADRRYAPRRLGPNDRIYRGADNRYYCRRSDGTTGLIIGGIGGGVLGNLIAPGGSKTVGSLIGGSLGAVLGNAIDRNNISCR